jgi:hypothetical protein
VVLEQGVEPAEDPGNAVEGLIAAPNQSSENFDPTTPNPTQEGKPGHNPLLYLYCNLYIFIYTSALVFLELLENPSCISLGTNVLNIST